MQKLFSALVALLLAASFGAAYAAPTQGGYVTGDPQQDAPKDCKKDPNDPRCKGGLQPSDPQQDQPKDCKKDPNDPRCKGGN
jgi:hypothetical protein